MGVSDAGSRRIISDSVIEFQWGPLSVQGFLSNYDPIYLDVKLSSPTNALWKDDADNAHYFLPNEDIQLDLTVDTQEFLGGVEVFVKYRHYPNKFLKACRNHCTHEVHGAHVLRGSGTTMCDYISRADHHAIRITDGLAKKTISFMCRTDERKNFGNLNDRSQWTLIVKPIDSQWQGHDVHPFVTTIKVPFQELPMGKKTRKAPEGSNVAAKRDS